MTSRNDPKQPQEGGMSRREALLDTVLLGLALPSALTALLTGCGRKEEFVGPSTPQAVDQDRLARETVEAVRLLLRAGFARTGDPLAKTVAAVEVELEPGRRDLKNGQLSAAHWDPERKVIGVPAENARNFAIVALAVAIGHEYCHAESDTVSATKIPLREYYTAEIVAHRKEADRVIPALEGMLSQRGLDPRLDGLLLNSLKSDAELSILIYTARRDIYLPLQESVLPEISKWLAQGGKVSQSEFDALLKLKNVWDRAQERRFRSREDIASELESVLGAFREAAKIPVLQPPLEAGIKNLDTWSSISAALAERVQLSKSLSDSYTAALNGR